MTENVPTRSRDRTAHVNGQPLKVSPRSSLTADNAPSLFDNPIALELLTDWNRQLFMDCVIPGHLVRPFSMAIGCLSRIGKDLYVEFDPIEGLALRTLNDAKSAYACFQYQPTFFERCTAPPAVWSSSSRKRTLNETTTTASQDETRFSCRVPMRALVAVIRPRKAVVALRLRSESTSSVQFLSFEIQSQLQDSIVTVVHRLRVADTNSVSAVAPKDGCSEIVASPRVLLRLLDPLKKTGEVALIIRRGSKAVSASSFHHSDVAGQPGHATNNNAILQAASASLLKTETAIGCDEFDEFDFHENRSSINEDDEMPAEVNREVILVFPMKEAKSMLQFCSHSHLDQELRVTVSFHWGGKPLILEAGSDTFSAQLVLATLDYKLLTSLRSGATEDRG